MKNLKLSNQAMGAVMMALQNSLMTQTDIVAVLKEFNFVSEQNSELIVTNPPTIMVSQLEEDNELGFVGEE
jgi:hypothetical protein